MEHTLPKKTLETLIKYEEDSLKSSQESLDNPLQQMVGTAHIIIDMQESRERLNDYKEQLKNYQN